MLYFLGALSLALAAAAIFALRYGLRERRRRKGRPFFDSHPVKPLALEKLDPIFTVTEHGPSLESEVLLVGDVGSYASTSTTEAWILGALAKRASCIFEFGTCTGRTTYIFARNSPEDARIGTITLGPDDVETYKAGAEDPEGWTKEAIAESQYTDFLYTDTPVASKVTQIFGDSKAFDETPWLGACDLIFVDGAHAYSYVKSDTEKALRMIRPGGVIVWHDFSPACPGVWKYLGELAATHPLGHIAGTRLAVMRAV